MVMSRIAGMRTAALPAAHTPMQAALAGSMGTLLLGIAMLFAWVDVSALDLSFDAAYWLELGRSLGFAAWTFALNASGLALASMIQGVYSDLMGAAPALAAALLLALFAIGPSEFASALRPQMGDR